MFTPPRPNDKGEYELSVYATPTLTDLRNLAATDQNALVASLDKESPDEAVIGQAEELSAFVAAADAELDRRDALATRAQAQKPIEQRTATPATTETTTPDETVTADGGFDADGNKDVADSTPAVPVANAPTEVVAATVTASGGTGSAPARSVQISDVAPHSPAADIPEGGPGYTLIAAADIASFPTGSEMSWGQLGVAFEERVRAYPAAGRGVTKARMQHSLARIRRDFPDTQVVFEGDSHEQAFNKLRETADNSAKDMSLVAANGWCAPSEPDYSICSPITSEGLLNLPEMVLRRGGLLHNQGLDFADFFGADFVLPIPGYNILTEAQVIADTAKTCVEIPCPTFVDDRLNVAALCLTSSLLQNRGYPEFVSEFTQGAIAAMAHLVNREVINEIVTGSTAVNLSTVDPWQPTTGDNTVWSQVLSAVEFAIMDMRYVYRTAINQRFTVVLPYWLRAQMRADYIRGNARANNDLADAEISSAFSARGADVQWVYDWQDAFNPGALAAVVQAGNVTPPLAFPSTLQFLVFLPGTWVLGRLDVIRLDTVYDSTNLQQNLVTQLFMEDGFKPMRMCQFSRNYTVPICPSGRTGGLTAIVCADVTP